VVKVSQILTRASVHPIPQPQPDRHVLVIRVLGVELAEFLAGLGFTAQGFVGEGAFVGEGQEQVGRAG